MGILIVHVFLYFGAGYLDLDPRFLWYLGAGGELGGCKSPQWSGQSKPATWWQQRSASGIIHIYCINRITKEKCFFVTSNWWISKSNKSQSHVNPLTFLRVFGLFVFLRPYLYSIYFDIIWNVIVLKTEYYLLHKYYSPWKHIQFYWKFMDTCTHMWSLFLCVDLQEVDSSDDQGIGSSITSNQCPPAVDTHPLLGPGVTSTPNRTQAVSFFR